jgi:hypothetical protein
MFHLTRCKNFDFIGPFKSALHVSGDNFAHPQEHFECIYSFWYDRPTLLPTGDTVQQELQFHTVTQTTSSNNNVSSVDSFL